MDSERQRKRNIRRINRAFGKCRISWNQRVATVKSKDPVLEPYPITVKQKGSKFEVCCEHFNFKAVDYGLSNVVQQLKLTALLVG